MASQYEDAPMMLDQMESASENTPHIVSYRFSRIGKVAGGVALVGAALAICVVAGYGKNRALIESKSVGAEIMLNECRGSTDMEKCQDRCGGNGGCYLGDNNFNIECTNGQVTKCQVGLACFPGTASVHVAGAGEITMKAVRIGDPVLVGFSKEMPVYEPLLSFIHVTALGLESDFLVVHHMQGQFRVSSNHLVFISSGVTKKAVDLMPGDELVVGGMKKTSRVIAVHGASGTTGMYAPLTASGTVVVDGVWASNYANIPAHAAAHAVFFFVRLYHQLGLNALLPAAKSATVEADELHPWAALLHNKYFKVDELIASP